MCFLFFVGWEGEDDEKSSICCSIVTNVDTFCNTSGDDPEDVKARLKYWAQAVACTVKLCN